MNYKRLAVAGNQCVDAGSFQPAALLRNLAAEKKLGHAEADKADRRFEQRGFDLLTFAGSFARRNGGKNAIATVKAAEVIRERCARSFRLVEICEYAQKPAQRLTKRVVAGLFSIRPVLAEGGYRTVDDARIDLFNFFVADAQAINDAGAKVFHDHIGVLRQSQEDFFAFRLLDVESHTFLVAVHAAKARAVILRLLVPGAKRIPRAGGFDLVNFRAQVRKQHGRKRPRDIVRDVENLDPVQCARHEIHSSNDVNLIYVALRSAVTHSLGQCR